MIKRPFAFVLSLIAMIALSGAAGLVMAQDGRPQEFDLALADLSSRLGRSLTVADFDNPTSRWEWRGVDFADSSLECPAAGEVVTPGVVTGYQFIFVLNGRKYDYRVALFKPESLRFCANPTGAIYDVTLVPTSTPRVDPPPEFDAALVELGKYLGQELTLTDFDQVGYGWTWRYREFRNSQLECPKVGVTTDKIVTPGWVFTFTVARKLYEYRVPMDDVSGLFLCKAPAQ